MLEDVAGKHRDALVVILNMITTSLIHLNPPSTVYWSPGTCNWGPYTPMQGCYRQSTKSSLCHPSHLPPCRNAAKRMSSLSHPFANFPSERSRQGRLRYPYFEKICSTSPVNAADRNGYRIRFFHLEMWHFPSERSQHSRKGEWGGTFT